MDEEDAAPGSQATISAEGYADDTYMITAYLLSLLAMLAATSKWLTLTGQEVNASKSLAFAAAHSARGPPTALEATLDGVRIPTQQEFRQLGVGVRTVPRRGTGPLLHKRITEGKAALRKTRTIPGGFDRKATVAAVMIVAATLFGVELADVAPRDVSSLESAIMTAIWGPSRPCRAKEVVFALLLPGHRVAPSMVVPYKRMCWLANIARVPGTAQVITQAVWEHTEEPKGTGPLGRALREFRRLGWRNQRGWWSWTMPRTGISVHLVHAAKEYVEHLFRESLREHHLEALEKRRPRLFGGMGARIDRELTLSELARCATELDRSMLRGVMAGALWTADKAHRRGMRQDGNCPYCSKGTREDEDHLLWWCAAWKSAREPFLPELMLLARALKLGALSDWPPCLRLCGLLSEEVVKRSGLARGPGWKKRCKELNRVSRHWVLQPPFPRPTKTCLPAMGQLPRDWKWGPDFQPAVLRWLSELQWLPGDDSLPEAHRQVSFLELALDFESYTGRPLPPTPQTRFKGGEMSLQEKGRVLRLAVSLLGKAAGRESILPVGFTNRCRSLVPLGAGTTVGVKGRPIFTRPAAVWHHLRRMQQYSGKRWAQQ